MLSSSSLIDPSSSMEGMSSDQLREHLYRTLQGKGVLDSVKSQLRNRLATELQTSVSNRVSKHVRQFKPSSSEHSPSLSPVSYSLSSLTQHIASSLVAEYLKEMRFDYSLSVFIPEANVNIDKICLVQDLIKYLRIPTSSPLCQSLKSPEHKGGLLVQLLEALLANSNSLLHRSHKDSDDDYAQPSSSDSQGAGFNSLPPTNSQKSSRKPTVDEELKALDQSYALKAEQQSVRHQQNHEERLLAFQRDLEGQYKRQFETELSLYQSRDMANMRLEERERYQEDLARERAEMSQEHQKKMEKLRKSEVQMMEKFRKKEQELESRIYSQRQALLDELGAQKVRESELKRQSELNIKAAKLEEERVNVVLEKLSGKEKALQHMKEHYEIMAKDRAEKHKLDFESRLQLKQSELLKWESELKTDREKMASHKSEIETAREQLKQMADYPQLQKRLQDLQEEVAKAEKKYSEKKAQFKHTSLDQQRFIKELQSQITHPNLECENLRRELNQLRSAHHKEVLSMECSNKELTRQLALQAEYTHKLQDRLDEQLVQLMSAQREVQDVYSLMGKLKPAVARGKYGAMKFVHNIHRVTSSGNKPHPTVPDVTYKSSHSPNGNVPSHSLHSTHPPSLRPHNITSLQGDLVMAAPDLGNSHQTQAVSFSDASSQLLAETRETFARLEREAQELEVTYNRFHHKHNGVLGLDSTEVPRRRSVANSSLGSQYGVSPAAFSQDPALYSYTGPTFTTLGSAQSPANIASSKHDSQVTFHQFSPPPTAMVWSSSMAVSVKSSPPPVHLPPDNLNITSLSEYPVGLVSAQAPSSSSHETPPSCVSAQAPSNSSHETPPSCVSAQAPSSSSHETPPSLPGKPLLSNLASVLLTDKSPPTSATAVIPLVISPPPVPTTTSSPPAISLEDLWKSAQNQRQANVQPSERKIVPESEDKIQHSELGNQRGKEETKHTSLDALPLATNQELTIPDTHSPLSNQTHIISSPTDGGEGGTGNRQGQSTHEKNGIDHVMLKYMDLVKQTREHEVESQETPLAHDLVLEQEAGQSKVDDDFGIPSLSQVSENFGGFSDKEDDLFDDW